MEPKQEALDNALIRAAHVGDLAAAQAAIKAGANIHARDERPVRAAIIARQRDMIAYLIKLGARVNFAQVAIGYASENNISDARRLLAIADGGKFGAVSRKVTVTDHHGRACEGRQFSDGSVLALLTDFTGKPHPCVVSRELMARVK